MPAAMPSEFAQRLQALEAAKHAQQAHTDAAAAPAAASEVAPAAAKPSTDRPVVAVRGDDRPGAKKDTAAPAGREARGPRDHRPERGSRPDRAERPERGPRLYETQPFAPSAMRWMLPSRPCANWQPKRTVKP